jgi:hypothetical protein
LRRQIKVIPVIIDDAVVPEASDLLSDLRPLANRQAITLRNGQFDQDFAALVETLREALGADQLNGGGANGSTANNVPLVIQAKKFQELVHRYLTTGRRLGAGRFIVGLLIFVAVALFIYVLQAPVGGPGSNSPREEANRTEAVRPPRDEAVGPPRDVRAAEEAARALERLEGPERGRDVPRVRPRVLPR